MEDDEISEAGGGGRQRGTQEHRNTGTGGMNVTRGRLGAVCVDTFALAAPRRRRRRRRRLTLPLS